MKEITILPAGYAEGTVEEPYTARPRKRPRPSNPELYGNSNTNGHIHLVRTKVFYRALDPKRLNRLDVITSKSFIRLLEIV